MAQPSGAVWGSSAQGHFDMRTGGAGVQDTDLSISGRPALPSEPQLPYLITC